MVYTGIVTTGKYKGKMEMLKERNDVDGGREMESTREDIENEDEE